VKTECFAEVKTEECFAEMKTELADVDFARQLVDNACRLADVNDVVQLVDNACCLAEINMQLVDNAASFLNSQRAAPVPDGYSVEMCQCGPRDSDSDTGDAPVPKFAEGHSAGSELQPRDTQLLQPSAAESAATQQQQLADAMAFLDKVDRSPSTVAGDELQPPSPTPAWPPIPPMPSAAEAAVTQKLGHALELLAAMADKVGVLENKLATLTPRPPPEKTPTPTVSVPTPTPTPTVPVPPWRMESASAASSSAQEAPKPGLGDPLARALADQVKCSERPAHAPARPENETARLKRSQPMEPADAPPCHVRRVGGEALQPNPSLKRSQPMQLGGEALQPKPPQVRLLPRPPAAPPAVLPECPSSPYTTVAKARPRVPINNLKGSVRAFLQDSAFAAELLPPSTTPPSTGAAAAELLPAVAAARCRPVLLPQSRTSTARPAAPKTPPKARSVEQGIKSSGGLDRWRS